MKHRTGKLVTLLAIPTVLVIVAGIFYGAEPSTMAPTAATTAEQANPATNPRHQVSISSEVRREKGAITVTGNRKSTRPVKAIVKIDGQPSLEITITPYTGYTLYEPENLTEEFGRMSVLAMAGDEDAAISLYTNLYNCGQRGFDTEAELEAAILGLYNEYSYPSADGQAQIHVSPDDVDLVVEEKWLRDTFRRCHGVGKQQVANATDWLQLASNNGSLAATKALINRLAPGKERFDLLERAWQHGDYLALYDMAQMQLDGKSGHASSPDDIYTNLLIFERVLNASPASTGAFRGRLKKSKDLIANLENILHQSSIEDAEQRAYQRLKDSIHCCVGPVE